MLRNRTYDMRILMGFSRVISIRFAGNFIYFWTKGKFTPPKINCLSTTHTYPPVSGRGSPRRYRIPLVLEMRRLPASHFAHESDRFLTFFVFFARSFDWCRFSFRAWCWVFLYARRGFCLYSFWFAVGVAPSGVRGGFESSLFGQRLGIASSLIWFAFGVATFRAFGCFASPFIGSRMVLGLLLNVLCFRWARKGDGNSKFAPPAYRASIEHRLYQLVGAHGHAGALVCDDFRGRNRHPNSRSFPKKGVR